MEKLPERKRFTLELDGEILHEIDGIRKSWGLRSYGATINILLRELLCSQGRSLEAVPPEQFDQTRLCFLTDNPVPMVASVECKKITKMPGGVLLVIL